MFISPFVASPTAVVRRLLTLAELRPGEVLYDLGAGDGKPIIMAAQEFKARAIGIELREDLARRTTKKIYDLGLQDRVKIVNEDIFRVDLRPANVVYLYLTTSANEKVRPKLEADLKRTSTEGRWRLTKGPSFISTWYRVPLRLSSACLFPGEMSTLPGSTVSSFSASLTETVHTSLSRFANEAVNLSGMCWTTTTPGAFEGSC